MKKNKVKIKNIKISVLMMKKKQNNWYLLISRDAYSTKR